MIAVVVGLFVVSVVMPTNTAIGTVSYELAWDFEGVSVNQDGSWSVTSDLGYDVTVTDGQLTTFSATLVACPHFHGVFDRILGFVSPAVAWAGHSSADDPALVGGPIAQSLIDTAPTDLGSTDIHEPSFCEGFTNWGAGASVETIASGEADPTVTLAGSWTDGSGSTQPLEIASVVNWGTKSPLIDATGRQVYAETSEAGTTITIVRSLAHAFDGIDFTTADNDEIATSFLRSLAAATEFRVTGGVTHNA